MIRKFFAFLILNLFVFTLPPLLILLSMEEIFLDESNMRQRVIPQSFRPITGILAELFSRVPSEVALFKERIEQAISVERYTALLGSAVTPFFENLRKKTDTLELDFSLLKSELRKEFAGMAKRFPLCEPTEQGMADFRFCKPAELSDEIKFEVFIENVLEKAIPSRVAFGNNPEAIRLLRAALLTKQFLPIITIVVSLVLLGLMALVIFSPLFSILKWTGSAVLSLTLVMVLFLISMDRLPQLLPLQEVLTLNQIDLLIFLFGLLIAKLKLWTFFFGAGGILLFGSGIVVQSRREL